MVEHTRQACLWAWGCEDWSTPSFGSLLNPIFQPSGADYSDHILISPPSLKATGAPDPRSINVKLDAIIASQYNLGTYNIR